VFAANRFSKVAEPLDMPASTLPRHISVRETDVGFRLLNRATRKVDASEESAACLAGGLLDHSLANTDVQRGVACILKAFTLQKH
jgi:hypothetical protein